LIHSLIHRKDGVSHHSRIKVVHQLTDKVHAIPRQKIADVQFALLRFVVRINQLHQPGDLLERRIVSSFFRVKESRPEMIHLVEEFLVQISEQSDRLAVSDKPSWIPENFRDKKLLASYSCLVHKDKVDRLGEILDAINSLQGFRVRFTGPWAPFSFVDLQEMA